MSTWVLLSLIFLHWFWWKVNSFVNRLKTSLIHFQRCNWNVFNCRWCIIIMKSSLEVPGSRQQLSRVFRCLFAWRKVFGVIFSLFSLRSRFTKANHLRFSSGFLYEMMMQSYFCGSLLCGQHIMEIDHLHKPSVLHFAKEH